MAGRRWPTLRLSGPRRKRPNRRLERSARTYAPNLVEVEFSEVRSSNLPRSGRPLGHRTGAQRGFIRQLATRWSHSWRGLVASGCDLSRRDFGRISGFESFEDTGPQSLPLLVHPYPTPRLDQRRLDRRMRRLHPEPERGVLGALERECHAVQARQLAGYVGEVAGHDPGGLLRVGRLPSSPYFYIAARFARSVRPPFGGPSLFALVSYVHNGG